MILQKRKKINVSDIYSDINLYEKEFTDVQVDMILSKKVFYLLYKSNYIITNIPSSITHISFNNNCPNLNIIPYLHCKIYHIEFNNYFNQNFKHIDIHEC